MLAVVLVKIPVF